MIYSFLLVKENPYDIFRDEVNAIQPGDILELVRPLSKEEFARYGIVTCFGFSGQSLYFHTKHVELLNNTDHFQLVSGDRAVVKDIVSHFYSREVVIIGKTSKVSLFHPVEQFQKDKGKNTCILNIFLVPCKIGCVCNFYEREAYGCRCGRIVG